MIVTLFVAHGVAISYIFFILYCPVADGRVEPCRSTSLWRIDMAKVMLANIKERTNPEIRELSSRLFKYCPSVG